MLLNKFIISLNLISLMVFPSNVPNIKVNTNLGQLTIYFTSNSIDYKLTYDESSRMYINTSSSTLSGYFVYNNKEYTIRFPVLDTPYVNSSNTIEVNYMEPISVSNLYLYNSYHFYTTHLLAVASLLILFIIFLRI